MPGQPLKDLETLQVELRQHIEILSPSSISSPGNNKLKFFKKHGKEGSSAGPTRTASDDYFEAKPMNSELLLKQFEKALGAIRQQHEALAAAVRGASSTASSSDRNLAGAASPIKTYASRSSAAFYGNRASMSRASSFSIGSNDEDDFYDAVPGEFVLEEEDDQSSDEEPTTPGESTLGDDDDSDDDDETDVEQGHEMSPEPEASAESGSVKVHRRTKLPAPAGEEFSMLGLLRKNVGKVGQGFRCAC